MENKIVSRNPATGKVEKQYDVMTDDALDDIISGAVEGYRQWKQVAIQKRTDIMRKVANAFRENKQEMARLCAVEMGKIIIEGEAEVELCANIIEYYADHASNFLADQPLESSDSKAFLRFDPIGPILSVQPWNFPYYQVIRNVAPNLMAGNTIILKHASNVPQCAEMLDKLFNGSGLPGGVFSNIFVPGAKATELVGDERIKGVTLTGSRPAGESVAQAAGKNVKKSVLELGGSDPVIVLEDADFEKAVVSSAMGRIRNVGQVCTSPKRIIVSSEIYDKFLKRCIEIYSKVRVGDPTDPHTQMGPLSSEDALEKIQDQIRRSVEEGARLVYGGEIIEGNGYFMKPAILTDIPRGTTAYKEELFGPVLCIFRAENDDEAVRLANDTEFGLGASIFSENIDRAVSIAGKIESGMVRINAITSSSPQLPFGGTKTSGYGRELSQLGMYGFVNPKLIRIG